MHIDRLVFRTRTTVNQSIGELRVVYHSATHLPQLNLTREMAAVLRLQPTDPINNNSTGGSQQRQPITAFPATDVRRILAGGIDADVMRQTVDERQQSSVRLMAHRLKDYAIVAVAGLLVAGIACLVVRYWRSQTASAAHRALERKIMRPYMVQSRVQALMRPCEQKAIG